jgi:hypothetical protein
MIRAGEHFALPEPYRLDAGIPILRTESGLRKDSSVTVRHSSPSRCCVFLQVFPVMDEAERYRLRFPGGAVRGELFGGGLMCVRFRRPG